MNPKILYVASIRRKLLKTAHTEAAEKIVVLSALYEKEIKNIMKYQLYTNASKNNRW